MVCSRCLHDNSTPGITFLPDGSCSYCANVAALKAEYRTGQPGGISAFDSVLAQIKSQGKGRRYDCIIGMSGGTDSSYLLHMAKSWGLRPLAVHYDNTWNTAIASKNIWRVTSNLEVDLFTYVVDNLEMDDIFRSFFLSGVAEIEAPTDLGYAYVLRRVAAKHKIKFILEGHSFVEEGVTPLTRNYFDGRYIRAIHREFGSLKMKSYPLMTFSRFLWSVLWHQPKFIRPFWYLNYSKIQAKNVLSSLYGWEDYGGHHLENRMTGFFHSFYLPVKFGVDMSINVLSAAVREGHLSRGEADKIWSEKVRDFDDLVDYFQLRLQMSSEEFHELIGKPPRHWTEFPTYKRLFERLEPLFGMLAKHDLVPRSFHAKYCFPANGER